MPFNEHIPLNDSETLIGEKANTTYYPEHSSSFSFGHKMEDVRNSTNDDICDKRSKFRRRNLGGVFCNDILLVV